MLYLKMQQVLTSIDHNKLKSFNFGLFVLTYKETELLMIQNLSGALFVKRAKLSFVDSH